ncbi:SAM-dependent methyltransferase [Antrihabitans cavernicola]|uniref:SAM-dependent methyltransferase n=2 Tax=Antrihabitans cavernicola TaxID=2495913 RepID=A0A5A7S902_9NOCA|nr:SAM-dependent methyltransferase [Spelaeibacter cavernicola]
MSLLADRLDGLATALVGVDAAIADQVRELCLLAGGLDPYLSRWSTPESEALRLLDQRTREAEWSPRSGLEQEMLSGHVEGQFLQMLVHATQATRVLEIGMFTGYSALAMAEALPEDGTLMACEIDAAAARLARELVSASASGHKIDIALGPAEHTLDRLSLADAQFDLIFIDADKSGYVEYLDTVLDTGLLARAGLIVVDNTMMQGQPWASATPNANGVAIAEFNQFVATDPRVAQVLIPLRDGVTLIRRVDGS